MRWSSVGAAVYGFAVSVTALDRVSVYGNKFFNKDGSQFFLKGIAYQLSPDDPLVDTDQCKRDVGLMKELGANSLRVYHVDPTANHDGCMKTFADAGIYVLIDMDTFSTYIVPDDLFWDDTQFKAYAKVMDAFQGYENTLGFFVGNEVIAQKDDSKAAPFVKAAARDMKAYRDSKGYPKIPVGYSAADIKELRPMLQDYLTCGGNSSEIIDFFGLNSYSWCGDSNFQLATYDQLEEYAKNFPVPIFFTETGCIVPSPRTWTDQAAIFGPKMVNDWSGAIVYEWIQEENKYGIISYGGGDTVVREGTPTPKQPDFNNLKSQWATLTPTGVKIGDVKTSTLSTRPCPTSTNGGWWEVDGNVKLPTLGETLSPNAVFTTVASASADPSDKVDVTTVLAKPTKAASGGSDGSDGSSGSSGSGSSGGSGDDDHKGAASLDKRITVMGATLAGVVLGFCILL